MMFHRKSPLTLEGRRRLIERCQTRPISHVAAEMGLSRATASKWVNRHRAFGHEGLLDRSSTPLRQPTATSGAVVRRVEWLRREHKWSASRIAFELEREGVCLSRRTVTRLLGHLGLSHRRFIDPAGETNREPQRIIAERPGHMVHIDVKKVGRIPDGGGWRIHSKGSPPSQSGRPREAARIAGWIRLPAFRDRRLLATGVHGSPPTMRRASPQLSSWPEPATGSPPTASSPSNGS